MAKFVKCIKKFSFVICLLVVALVAGCFSTSEIKSYSASYDYYIEWTTAINYNGTVIQMLDFGINAKGQVASASEIELYKKKIIALVDEIKEGQIQTIRDKYNAEGDENYNPSQIFYSDAEYSSQTDSVFYMIEYDSNDVYKYYNEGIENSTQPGFFVSKSIQTQSFPFYKLTASGDKSLAQDYKERFLSAIEGLSFKNTLSLSYQPQYSYDYITWNGRVKSNCDTLAEDDGGYYHHIWRVRDTSNSGREAVLTLNIIHAGWWYLLGAGVPLIVMLIAILCVKFFGKKEEEKPQRSPEDEFLSMFVELEDDYADERKAYFEELDRKNEEYERKLLEEKKEQERQLKEKKLAEKKKLQEEKKANAEKKKSGEKQVKDDKDE